MGVKELGDNADALEKDWVDLLALKALVAKVVW